MILSQDSLESIGRDFAQEIATVATINDLENLRIAYLGRSGKMADLMAHLKGLAPEQKQLFGPLLNQLKQDMLQAYSLKKQHFIEQNALKQLQQQRYFDVTIEKKPSCSGSIHPLTQTTNAIRNIFLSMGYKLLEGPEAEHEFYNFEALNIPESHPARDMWDTLWLNVPKMLLRTHTSSVQIHAMEKKELPLAVLAMGRVFRHEATDATHDFMFNQAEGLVIDKNISLSDLLGTIEAFCKLFFKKDDLKIRVRPSYFPFVEPGIEIDITCIFCTTGCATCKKTKFIEVAGAGLVHPNVLKSVHIDPRVYSGFAFGFGIDRLAMLKNKITDIRYFASGNIAFLNQF